MNEQGPSPAELAAIEKAEKAKAERPETGTDHGDQSPDAAALITDEEKRQLEVRDQALQEKKRGEAVAITEQLEAGETADQRVATGPTNKVYLGGSGNPKLKLAAAVGLGGLAMFVGWGIKKTGHGIDKAGHWLNSKIDGWIKKGKEDAQINLFGLKINPAKWGGAVIDLGGKIMNWGLKKVNVDLSTTLGQDEAKANQTLPKKGGKKK